MRCRYRVLLVAVALQALAGTSDAANLTCSSATTLTQLATCIANQMPGSGSNGFVAPSAQEQADWRSVVAQMMDGACDFALPASLAANAQIRTFTDTSSARSYCLLMEVLDGNNNGKVDKGYGTFIVNNSATLEISHQAPHALYDIGTEVQAIEMFGGTNSRSYVMTGAHRNANSGSSACQSSYAPADAAHNVNNMFHQTQVALMAFYGGNDWQAIQWHGMGIDTCDENAFLSHGMAINPGASDTNLQLKNNMTGKHPSWDLGTPVSGGCALNATDNVQGRLINGVNPANVCSTAASNYNGRFLHIEQDPGFRTAADWIPSVNEVWGAPATPPPAPTNLAASGGNAQVSLAWNGAQDANTYNVHRSTVSGGPYATIATGIAATSYLDTTVTNGTTYYYVVSGQNGAGEGPDSNQASATPQVPQLPPAPTGVAATSPTKRKINVTWNAVAGATSYRVKRSTTSGGPYTLVGTATGTSFVNSGLTSGTTYYYVVSAVNGVGEGPNSAQVSAVAR